VAGDEVRDTEAGGCQHGGLPDEFPSRKAC
jgi:hypothetical protein